jgi:hypothetical protein
MRDTPDSSNNDEFPPIMSLADLKLAADEFEAYYAQRLVYHPENQTLELRFGYPYEVDLDEINTAEQLLGWVIHLTEKDWLNTTDLRMFAERVAELKGINIHG